MGNEIIPNNVEKERENEKEKEKKVCLKCTGYPSLKKTPYKARFIAGSRKCTTTKLSIKLSRCHAYCKTTLERSGFNSKWIFNNITGCTSHAGGKTTYTK